MFILKNLKQKTNLFSKFVFVMFVFLLPVSVNAQVFISEIMYDAEGSDTGKEWIEICNTGEDVNLEGWKLLENESGHNISIIDGVSINLFIARNQCVVVVVNKKDINNFYECNPGFSKNLLYSAFNSLNNSSLKITLKDLYGIDIDSVSYTSDQRANGNGNSLQLINGEWIEAFPTPGLPNVSESQSSQIQTQTQEQNTNQKQEIVSLPELKTQQIFADAGKDRSVIVGADTQFKGIATGLENALIENARFSWSFGDGDIQDGKNILHNYKYPGDYIVVLNISSGEYSASDRILVKALPADIVISDANNNFIELQNNSDYELNLSWWRIRSGENFFTIPKDTIVLPNSSLKISSKITGFYQNDLLQVFLLYPNGEIVKRYNVNPPKKQNSVSGHLPVPIGSLDVQRPSSGFLEKESVQETENLEVEIPSDESEKNLALVGNINKDNGLLNKWTFSLMGLILFSIAGFFVATKFTSENEEIALLDGQQHQLKPEDFKII